MHYVTITDFLGKEKKETLKGTRIQIYKGNNKITELRTILQRESQNS